MINKFYRKTLVFGLTILFIFGAILPSINGELSRINTQNKIIKNQDISSLTFYTFDKTGSKQQNVNLSKDISEEITNKIEELKYQTINNPLSEKTRILKQDFIETLDTFGLIPDGLTKDYVLSLINPKWQNWFNNKPNPNFKEALYSSLKPFLNIPFFKNNNALLVDWNILCNMASGGAGIPLPLFMLPRPRGIALWFSSSGITYTSSLLIGKNFVAYGSQQGMAIGFVGVGLTGSFYGMTGYIFLGYAAYTMMQAEAFESYTPPNQEPEITDENPVNGAVEVPLSLSELSFRISDHERDNMDYTVTTNPYIGTGSGNNKKNGIYKIPISGLVGNTKYSWKISVNDDYSTVEKEYNFTTEMVAPIITDPVPSNDDNWVPIDTTQLSFKLNDNQGDLMDYTIETSPNIGSSSGTDVNDGTYYLDITGLDQTTQYNWYVNVTDGTYWTREIFNFKTQPKMIFDPFDEGWQYRKKITINHNQVEGDLTDFPVLISRIDSDLKSKAQSDGNDILFMDGTGVANRLLHEIELFEDSNGELVAWVKIPDLSDSINTILYMYYGNPSCSSQQYPEYVWDFDYISVWHMDGDGYTEIKDSTNNNLDATGEYGDPLYLYNGQVGYSVDFDGNDKIIISDDEKFSFTDGINDQPLTIEAWINYDASENNPIISKWEEDSNAEWLFRLESDNHLNLYLFDPPWASCERATSDAITLNKWTYVVGKYDGSKKYDGINLFLDDSKDLGDGHTSSDYYHMDNFESKVQIACYRTHYFYGTIDEIRISDIERNDTWLSTSYNTMNDPSSFFSIGPEESAP